MPRTIEDYVNDINIYMDKFKSSINQKNYFKANDYLSIIQENLHRILLIVME